MPAEMPKEMDWVTLDAQRPAIYWKDHFKKSPVVEKLTDNDLKSERYKSKIKELISSNTKELVSVKTKAIVKDICKRYSKQGLYKEILSFKSLKESWDGYGAVPLEVESAGNAIFVINSLDNEAVESIDHVSPNPHGTISILWENGGNIVSLEIGNYEMSYYVEKEGNETLFFNKISINGTSISTLCSYVYWIISNEKTAKSSWGK